MSQKAFSLTAGVVFLLIALGHLLRVIVRATFVVEGVAVPLWASVLAVLVAGYLSYEGLRLGTRAHSE